MNCLNLWALYKKQSLQPYIKSDYSELFLILNFQFLTLNYHHSFFFDSCFLAGKFAQIIQLSATHFTYFIQCDVVNERFTVRKMSENIGVERIFPLNSPFIDSITLNKVGKVRRAKLYYLRKLTGKKARIKEKRVVIVKS